MIEGKPHRSPQYYLETLQTFGNHDPFPFFPFENKWGKGMLYLLLNMAFKRSGSLFPINAALSNFLSSRRQQCCPQFRNMNELVTYLGEMEERLKHLEEENRKLRAAPAPVSTSNVDERTIAKMVATFLPLTNIVHPSFLKRAFAVWGHFFVANLIITLPFTILYFCILAAAFSNMQNP
jgi:hypothetical protein